MSQSVVDIFVAYLIGYAIGSLIVMIAIAAYMIYLFVRGRL